MISIFLLAVTLSMETRDLMTRIDAAFPAEMLNDKSILIKDKPGRSLFNTKMWKDIPRSDRYGFDKFLISKIGQIEIPTNSEDLVSCKWIEDRADWVRILPIFRYPYENADDNFQRLVKCMSNIKDIEYAFKYGNRGGFVKPMTEVQVEINHEYDIRRQNLSRLIFRGTICRHGFRYVERASQWMSDCEFEVFSNQVVKAYSIPNTESCTLMRRKKSDDMRRIEEERLPCISGDYGFDRAIDYIRSPEKQKTNGGRASYDIVRDAAFEEVDRRWYRAWPLDKQWDVVCCWIKVMREEEIRLGCAIFDWPEETRNVYDLLEDFRSKGRYSDYQYQQVRKILGEEFRQ